MRLTKYVMLQDVRPILFEGLNHDEFKALGLPITSAGFFKIVDGKVVTFGESLTLHMIPAPVDAMLIQKFLDGAAGI